MDSLYLWMRVRWTTCQNASQTVFELGLEPAGW